MAGKTCTCGKNFRDGEDWRDHMPCDGTEAEQLKALVVSLRDTLLYVKESVPEDVRIVIDEALNLAGGYV